MKADLLLTLIINLIYGEYNRNPAKAGKAQRFHFGLNRTQERLAPLVLLPHDLARNDDLFLRAFNEYVDGERGGRVSFSTKTFRRFIFRKYGREVSATTVTNWLKANAQSLGISVDVQPHGNTRRVFSNRYVVRKGQQVEA